MCNMLFFVLLNFAGLIAVSSATCSVTKNHEGIGDWLKCYNSSIADMVSHATNDVSAISISLSNISTIPGNTFLRFGGTLDTLKVQNCHIEAIDSLAFKGLYKLKKLTLSSNNISMLLLQWFRELYSLEELDLSFNMLTEIHFEIFMNLPKLRRLDVSNNLLTCLHTNHLESLGSLTRIRIAGNPLNYECRARVTLWLRNHGISYESDLKDSEDWLNSILWDCSISVPSTGERGQREVRLRECAIFNFFNQLKNALVTSTSYQNPIRECVQERSTLLQCVRDSDRHMTAGEAIKKLLLSLRYAAN